MRGEVRQMVRSERLLWPLIHAAIANAEGVGGCDKVEKDVLTRFSNIAWPPSPWHFLANIFLTVLQELKVNPSTYCQE